MPIMSNRIFFSLALLSFAAVTSVCSYDRYRPYGPRDASALRQVRRCPTCPADCPESLASPWYGSPTVYGQSGPFQASNENFEQGSYSARDSSGIYGNPYFGGSNVYENSRCPCSHGGCNARSPRSGKQASPSEAHVEVDAIPNRFDSMESRGAHIYDYHRAPSSFVPETYREMDSVVGAIPNTDNHRVSRHYGNYDYKEDTMPSDRRTTDEQSSGANQSSLSKWKSVSLSAQQPIAEYKNQPERMIYEAGRLKAVETPSQKKVFVVYRADADETIDDDDLDRSLISGTSRQQQSTEHSQSGQSITYPMTDFQLEEIVRRAIAAATRQNINGNVQQLQYDREQARGINYNEHERNPGESYNPRRPYNDDLYQRFNAEEAINRQEQRKLSYMRAGYAPSEVVYTPTMRYNPYVLPGVDQYQENISTSGQSAITESNEENEAAWQAQQMSQEGQTTILRDISRDEEGEKNQHEDQESFQSTHQDFMTTKRETDFETLLLPPPINYRTHSRTSETERVEQKQDNTSKPLENNTQKADDQPPNPDLTEDMEMPPIEDSEVQLQLNFQSFDNTTPLPTN